ncbi:MAG TPA: M3 family metallopeptidase [Armatimonadota bacterium]|jgi:oligoendopeptidase F
MTTRIDRIGVALAAALLAGASLAQTAFQPIPPEDQPKYRFDFKKNFFPNDAAFQKAVKQLGTDVAEIEKFKGKVTDSPRNLYRATKLSDDFGVLFGRVYVYQYLQYAINTKNTGPRDRAAELETRIIPRLAFLVTETQKLTPAQLDKYVKAYPPLKPYKYAISEALRSKPHTLSLKEEELLGKTANLMTKWQEDQYDLLLDRYAWGKVKDTDGRELDVRQDAQQIGNSKSREVRKEGYEKGLAGFQAQRDLFAFDLINRVTTRNKLAQIRGFKNNPDSRYFDMHLSYADVDTAFNQILERGALRKRLQEMQRARVKSFTGYDTVHSYDMSLVPPGVDRPRFTIAKGTQEIEDSTRYLGKEWNNELHKLLDPANGRLDIVAGPNRVPGAFTYPMQRGESPFFSYGYEGYLQDVSTLAHESGHAVHMSLMNNAGVLPSNMGGPSYFTESYAILDEIVLSDKLYREEQDPGRKVYYLEQLLSQMMSFYSNVRIAAIEKTVYEKVDKGQVKTADDLDKITHDIGAKVSIWHDLEPDTNALWEQVEHYYRSGTQYENYVFADLLAQTYFTMYQKDPAGFAKRFTALERNGFNDTPANLLKKFMGINMRDPKTYAAVFQTHEKYLNDLEDLYKKVPVQKMPAE